MKNFYCLALIGVALLCVELSEAKVTFKRSLVVGSDKKSEEDKDEKDTIKKPKLPQIYEMRVDTNVSNRYAKTVMTSKVRNLDSNAQEAIFSVVTPDKAFISGFVMEIDGKEYKAYVQEKEQAKQTYNQAKSSGYSAGHVAVSARDSNRFTVSVNLEPQSKAVFYLTYEELLVREDEKYEVVLNIHPGQPIKHFGVQVNIMESRPIKFVRVPSLRSGNEVSKNDKNADPEADIKIVNKTSAVVTFNPDLAKQKILATSLGGDTKEGLSGQFVVQYDVERDPQEGEVLVDGGYFVHFLAPEDLTPLKKQVVFVLDTSGSMYGSKITQLKEAMDSILSELKPEDIFSIVEFNSDVKIWNISRKSVEYSDADHHMLDEQGFTNQMLPSSFSASVNNIANAKETVRNFFSSGATNIYSALAMGLQIINYHHKDSESHQSLIIFLTDGEPNVGISNTEEIIEKITKLNKKKVPIFSLSFGDGADRAFLQRISLKNQGFARHIYEAADAHLQLENFYKQISSPLLSNVTFKYTGKVSNVTKRHFPILFHGRELYISGKFEDLELNPPQVEARGANGPIELRSKVYQASGSLERLWAYLTVRQLLEQREIAKDKTDPTEKALKIALKYSFVTDVSSLVVVKPNATLAVNTEDASKMPDSQTDQGIPFLRPHSRYHLLSFGAPRAASRPMISSLLPARDFGSALVNSQTNSFSSFEDVFAMKFSFEDVFTTTKVPSLESTTQTSLSNIPWIKKSLNPNGTLTINSVAYLLGFGEVLSVLPDCHNSVNNSTGTCTLLDKCPGVHSQLIDMETYKKHFCELEHVYAGVCCPTGHIP